MLAYQGTPHRTKLARTEVLFRIQRISGPVPQRHHAAKHHALPAVLPVIPRSVRFCIRQLDEQLHAISGTRVGSYHNEAERLTGRSLAQLNFSNIDHVLEAGYHPYIDELQSQFNEIGQQVFEAYILLPQEIRSLRPQELQSLQRQQQQQ